MKKHVVVWAAISLSVLGFTFNTLAQDIVWQEIGRGNLNLKTALVHPDDSRIIYLGSSNAVMKTEDGGETWRNILSIKGQNKAVNFLLFDPQDKNSLYAATGNGFFYSPNQGRLWRRIFQGKSYSEKECTSLAVLPSGIYLGTKAGLFISKDKGRSWHKETGQLGRSSILAIAYNLKEPSFIYVASVDGVFMTVDNGESWQKIFVAHPVENGDNGDEVSEDGDEEERFSEIRYISLDPNNTNYLYLATSNGVYRSKDKGKTWEAVTDYGLLERDIKSILVSSRADIYAVTKSGVFEYRNERWHELSLGLISGDIRFLTQDKSGNLYAACDNGLFKANLKNPSDTKDSIISFYFKDEPKISEVQEAAIKYAEVEPEKILLWRKKAAKKAWLPKLSVGLDRDVTDLWHWEGGSTTKAGDDILTRGRDTIEWDLSLSWDLSELIWNNDQTSIDVRSRLMVQLRDDILDEVTKVYFERLRVKIELDNLSIEDRKKRFEKELRIRELTAYLDGLTGGYFSRQLNNKG